MNHTLKDRMKSGGEVADNGPTAPRHGDEIRTTVPWVGAPLDQPRGFGPVEHAGDVARAELELTAELGGPHLPIGCEVEPDEQV